MRFYVTSHVITAVLLGLLLFDGYLDPIATGPRAAWAEEEAHEEQEEGGLHLSAAELEEFGIVLTTATAGALEVQVRLPGEVDVLLGETLPVNPQIKGALKSLSGVAMVEEL